MFVKAMVATDLKASDIPQYLNEVLGDREALSPDPEDGPWVALTDPTGVLLGSLPPTDLILLQVSVPEQVKVLRRLAEFLAQGDRSGGDLEWFRAFKRDHRFKGKTLGSVTSGPDSVAAASALAKDETLPEVKDAGPVLDLSMGWDWVNGAIAAALKKGKTHLRFSDSTGKGFPPMRAGASVPLDIRRAYVRAFVEVACHHAEGKHVGCELHSTFVEVFPELFGAPARYSPAVRQLMTELLDDLAAILESGGTDNK